MDLSFIFIYIVVSIIAIFRVEKFSLIDGILLGGLGLILIVICSFKPITEIADAESSAEGFYATSLNDRIEPFSTLLINISKQIFNVPAGMFFLFAVIAISIRLFGIAKYAAFVWTSVAIYLYQVFILHDLIQIRASIASAILLCSIAPLYRRNFKVFFCMGVVATLFHYSAVIMFGLYFFNPYQIKRWIYALILPICYCLAFVGLTLGSIVQYIPIPFVQQAFLAYEPTMATSDLEINILSWPQVVRCCIFLFLLFRYERIIVHYKYIILLIKLYAVGLCSYVVFADIPTFANRISELLFVFEILLFPLLAYVFLPRRVGLLIPLILGFSMLLINIYHFELIPS